MRREIGKDERINLKILLNKQYKREQYQNGTPNQGLTMGVTRAEVESALKEMKNNKATGPDEIPVEGWGCLEEKGDVQDCQNYRRIKLLSHTMKIWERFVDKRGRGEVEVAEEKFEFMPE